MTVTILNLNSDSLKIVTGRCSTLGLSKVSVERESSALLEKPDFDAILVDDEIARIRRAFQELLSIEQVFCTIGEPDYEIVFRVIKAGRTHSFRGFSYSGLSRVVRVIVVDYGSARRPGFNFAW